jgi:hypothetical protein
LHSYIIISFGSVPYFIFIFSFTVSVRSVHDGLTKKHGYTMCGDEFLKSEGMHLRMHMFSLWSSGLCSVSFRVTVFFSSYLYNPSTSSPYSLQP